jgi:uncharacterized membrane protein YdjX (TVP38/TMEM64 family)
MISRKSLRENPHRTVSKSDEYNTNQSDGEEGPFIPLEETINGEGQENGSITSSETNGDSFIKELRRNKSQSSAQLLPGSGPSAALPTNNPQLPLQLLQKLDGKKVVSSLMFTLLFLLVCDSMFSAPENRILRPDFSQTFLKWVQKHPAQGLVWILVFMASAVVFMIPIGTPITVGCGYIYKGAYGWRAGVAIATLVSMAGSALGAVICFLLGRYLMRDQVRKWIRKYPLFDAIDVASEQHGLRIMAMLYLTPILPLGPVSYMCGTTSMALHHFVLAKVAALPLMCLYVIIGASTGTLIHKNDEMLSAEQVQAIEENQALIVGGIVLSMLSIACITHYIKKELNQILEKQKREMHGDKDEVGADAVVVEEGAIELGKATSAPRQRKH